MKNTFLISTSKKSIAWLVPFLGLAILSSCINAPDFPDEPSISFKEIKKFTIGSDSDFGGKRDSVVISINFEDGDGDLGVSNISDTQIPNNFEAKLFLKEKGAFREIIRAITDSGKFPLLRQDGKTGPIEGVLSRYYDFGHKTSLAAPEITRSPLNDTIKFQVRIADRAQHWSGWKETAEIVINQK